MVLSDRYKSMWRSNRLSIVSFTKVLCMPSVSGDTFSLGCTIVITDKWNPIVSYPNILCCTSIDCWCDRPPRSRMVAYFTFPRLVDIFVAVLYSAQTNHSGCTPVWKHEKSLLWHSFCIHISKSASDISNVSGHTWWREKRYSSGSLLIECARRQQSINLLKAKHFANILITVSFCLV